MYGPLASYRQGGDIDILVDGDRHKVLDYLKRIGLEDTDWDYVHLHPRFFSDIEVELHYRVSVMRNPISDRKLQKYTQNNIDEFFISTIKLPNGGEIFVPSVWMDVFYQMLHIY